MTHPIPQRSRRLFLKTAALVLPSVAVAQTQPSVDQPTLSAAAAFPNQDPRAVAEMVAAAHGNVARVKELLKAHPALSRATIDWGFGDWESALDGAAHMGNREIAEILLAHGARPTIFSSAMLGELEVIKASVAASPGIEKIKGPHGITLLRHAMAGGARAQAVLDYLRTLPGADERPSVVPLSPEDAASLTGTYQLEQIGGSPLRVALQQTQLTLARGSRSPRSLQHRGNLEFTPAGAPDVRVRFVAGGGSVVLTVVDGDWIVSAKRVG